MYWLPIELVKPETTSVVERSVSTVAQSGGAVWLPCPTVDLLRLATSFDQNVNLQSSKSLKRLRKLLRLNPALVLFGLSRFRTQLGRVPNSTRELVLWCQRSLAQELVGLAQKHAPVRPRSARALSQAKLRKFFKKYLFAQSNRQLRKSLREFVCRISDINKDESKALINQVVGRMVRAKDFKCKQARAIETRWQIRDDWTVKIERVDALQLLRCAILAGESDRQFESRLRTEKLASMKQLAYGASHEINNPLANISTHAQTILAIEVDHEKRHKLAVIYEQAIRAHEMISDMMLFAHPPAISKQRVAVRLMVNKILHELEPVFQQSEDIEIFVTVGPGVSDIEVDPTQISVAIKNLIQNSIEAICSKSGEGRIEVRVDRLEAETIISVWDNGLEISDEVQKHLFDPFYSGREAGRGLGFGLSKVWTIARLHGGTIEYNDREKSGSQFILRLPQSPWVVNGAESAKGESAIILRENPPMMEEDAA